MRAGPSVPSGPTRTTPKVLSKAAISSRKVIVASAFGPSTRLRGSTPLTRSRSTAPLLAQRREGRRADEVDRARHLADLGRDLAADGQLGPRVRTRPRSGAWAGARSGTWTRARLGARAGAGIGTRAGLAARFAGLLAVAELAGAADQELAARAERGRQQRPGQAEPGTDVARIVGAEAGAAAVHGPAPGRRRRQPTDHGALRRLGDRLQIGEQLARRDRRAAGHRKGRRRTALGAVDEARQVDQAAVLGDHQQAALDHDVGGAGKGAAGELDRLPRLGLDLNAGARLRRPNLDLSPLERHHVERGAGGAGARELHQLLVAEPGEHRPVELPVLRVDQDRDGAARGAALAVTDLILEALQARLTRREGDCPVRVQGHLAAGRVARAQQLQGIAVRIADVVEDRHLDGGILGGGDADRGRLRRPVARASGRGGTALARARGIGLRQLAPAITHL